MQRYEIPIVWYPGNPYVKNDAVEVAGIKVTLEINASLGHNVHSGTVQNLSTEADLFVEVSNDGIIFTDAATLYPQQTLKLNHEDVHTIYLDASANATPYQVVAH